MSNPNSNQVEFSRLVNLIKNKHRKTLTNVSEDTGIKYAKLLDARRKKKVWTFSASTDEIETLRLYIAGGLTKTGLEQEREKAALLPTNNDNVLMKLRREVAELRKEVEELWEQIRKNQKESNHPVN